MNKCSSMLEFSKPPIAKNSSERPQVHVGILLLPQYSYLGLSLLIEPMVIANWLMRRAAYTWTIHSLDGQPVKATNGMLVPTEALPEKPGQYSTVFVVASFEAKMHSKSSKLRSWLQRERTFGAQIGGIETGTEILAASSLLDGRVAAVHWDNFEGFQETYPRVRASTQLFTMDAKVITCAGATAVADLMLAWIAESNGPKLAQEISQHLLYPKTRPQVESQLAVDESCKALMSMQVSNAMTLMQQSVANPLSCQTIATAVGLSSRQLERHFKQCMGTAPHQYYVNLRVATAHKLLQQTELSVSEVATATGFESLEHFSRVYKTRFGIPPSMDRYQSVAAPVMRHDSPPSVCLTWDRIATAAVGRSSVSRPGLYRSQ